MYSSDGASGHLCVRRCEEQLVFLWDGMVYWRNYVSEVSIVIVPIKGGVKRFFEFGGGFVFL